MNKLAIFDLDGTLIDSLPDIAFNLNIALEKCGHKKRTNEEFMQFLGNGARWLVERAIGDGATDAQIDECLKIYQVLYKNSGSPKTIVFEGLDQTLKTLKEKGYKLAILTNKPQAVTDTIYEKYLKSYGFDMVLGQSDKVKCKPDKTATEYILKTLDVCKENCYFIGDGETDVLTAINAGVKGVAVLWGYRSKDQLALAGAKTFAFSPKDILDLLD